eukprot:3005014-Rhodomonas_salina.1
MSRCMPLATVSRASTGEGARRAGAWMGKPGGVKGRCKTQALTPLSLSFFLPSPRSLLARVRAHWRRYMLGTSWSAEMFAKMPPPQQTVDFSPARALQEENEWLRSALRMAESTIMRDRCERGERREAREGAVGGWRAARARKRSRGSRRGGAGVCVAESAIARVLTSVWRGYWSGLGRCGRDVGVLERSWKL